MRQFDPLHEQGFAPAGPGGRGIAPGSGRSCPEAPGRIVKRLARVVLLLLVSLPLRSRGQLGTTAGDADALPLAPPGFKVTFFAREPLVRNPCAIAFDDRGRLFVGMGPQYRNPQPNTPGDKIVILEDTDGDGVADTSKTFAEGLNCVQGLAWHGRELWVGNAPDLTVLRDLDGDDVADEYVKMYTDLGNIEHGVHGLTWAPDGKLYFSKGNSKGLSIDGDAPKEPRRVAPRAFHRLWGVPGPVGTPEIPAPQVFRSQNYHRTYQDPEDDWGREGGILRCDARGRHLEIVARGCRNPWDIAFDAGFNWLGTDNDQNEGDKFIMPFLGAHFGWSHPWNMDWSGNDSAGAIIPASGPLFEGSGTGILFVDHPAWPEAYRGVFLVNDWLQRATYTYRPRWQGALLKPASGLEKFLTTGNALFKPVDMEIGPDGALYVSGWGREYGATWKNGQQINEGRIFRISPGSINRPRSAWWKPKRDHPRETWTAFELLEDLGEGVPIWKVNAQEELTSRGFHGLDAVIDRLARPNLPEGEETWLLWTVGRAYPWLEPEHDRILKWLQPPAQLNRRIQALRIMGWRISRSTEEGRHGLAEEVVQCLADPSPRIRFEAVQTLKLARQFEGERAFSFLDTETDPVAYYAAWDTLRSHPDPASLRPMLRARRGGAKRGILLVLLEKGMLTTEEVRRETQDADPGIRDLARRWLEQSVSGKSPIVVRGHPLPQTMDGVIQSLLPLTAPPRPSTSEEVLAVLSNGNKRRGEALFHHERGAGCAKCHQVNGVGQALGPDLSTVGSRADATYLVRSIVEPSRDIVEGYRSLMIETDEAEWSGVLLRETDLAVHLVGTDGQPRSIPKAAIRRRRFSSASAMPSFSESLTADRVADLTAYLLSLKTPEVQAREAGR